MEIEQPGRAVSLWAITDGRAGNVAQAMGLAEAIARRRPADIRQIDVAPKGWTARMPPRLWQVLALVPGWPEAGYRDLPDFAPLPDLVIGAGRRVAPLVAALGRRGASTVQLLDPQMAASNFDLVVAPRHDRLNAGNALATAGSIGRMTRERIEREAAALRPRLPDGLPEPRVAVLLGGPSGSATWKAGDTGALVRALAGLADQGYGLIVTPSRRTPEGLAARLAGDLGDRAWVWDGRGDNPYPGLLGLAEAVVVTQDSVNMTSEAATTGKPVYVFPLTRVGAKIRRFHDSLRQIGATRTFAGGIAPWDYEPLAEADRIAAEVDVRLLPR